MSFLSRLSAFFLLKSSSSSSFSSSSSSSISLAHSFSFPFASLPLDVCLLILQWLSFRDLLSVRRVSLFFFELSHHERAWKHVLLSIFSRQAWQQFCRKETGLVKHARLEIHHTGDNTMMIETPRFNQSLLSLEVDIGQCLFPYDYLGQLQSLLALSFISLDLQGFVAEGVSFIAQLRHLKCLVLPRMYYPFPLTKRRKAIVNANAHYYLDAAEIMSLEAIQLLQKQNLPNLEFLHLQLCTNAYANDEMSIELIRTFSHIKHLSIDSLPARYLRAFSGPGLFGTLSSLSLIFDVSLTYDDLMLLSSLKSVERLFLVFRDPGSWGVCVEYRDLFFGVCQLVRAMSWLKGLHLKVPPISHQDNCSCYFGGPLFLRHNNLKSVHLDSFFSLPVSMLHLDAAEELQCLSFDNIDFIGSYKELLNSVRSAKLEALDLNAVQFSIKMTLEDLIETLPRWPNLARLNIARNYLSGEFNWIPNETEWNREKAFLVLIALLPKHLRALDVSYLRCVNDAVLQTVVDSFPLLEQLGIAGTRFTAKSFASISKLRHLRIIDVSAQDEQGRSYQCIGSEYDELIIFKSKLFDENPSQLNILNQL